MNEQKQAPNKKLIWERESRGWTQQRALEEIQLAGGDISLRTLRRAENGKPVSLHTISALTKLYEKNAEELGLMGECPPERLADPLVPPDQQRERRQEAVPSSASLPLVHCPTGSQPVKPSISQSNRQRFLRRVRAFWIKGVLEHSLHNAALMALGLHEQPDAVNNPWRLSVQESHLLPRPLPSGTRIRQVYDDADGELLILGEPGAGKTTLLLELARDLLDRAEQDSIHLMPAVFNLSTWAVKRQPLAVWLVEELNAKYQIPCRVGQAWINTDQVLLLLDGLDEVEQAHRSACVDAINAYRQEHDLVPMVVCSRRAEYLAQATRLLLHSAVMLQPLTDQQIEEYFLEASGQLEDLRVALYEDSTLRELANTPLMLSVLTLAYQGKSLKDLLATGSPDKQRQQIFATYVERMLMRRRSETRYTSQQTIRWLTWLAKKLSQHSQTVFYIEQMQPNWISKRWPHQLISGLVAGLVSVLLIGVVSAFLFGLTGILYGSQQHILVGGRGDNSFMLVIYQYNPQTDASGLQDVGDGRVADGVIFALLFGLFSALIGGAVSVLKTTINPVEAVTWSWVGRWRRLVNGLLIGLGLGLLARVLYGLLALLSYALIDVQSLSSTHSFEQLITRYPPLVIIEAVLQEFMRFRPWGIIETVFLLKDGLIFGGVGLLIGGVMSRASSEQLDQHIRGKPNEGIRRSARHGILAGLVVTLAGGLSIGLNDGPINGLLLGLMSGVIIGLRNGGIACIQHLVLRLRLLCDRTVPWNYPHFLDYAVERILLRKVGGGYIFVHRLLLEYFASLDNPPNLYEARVEKQQAEPVP